MQSQRRRSEFEKHMLSQKVSSIRGAMAHDALFLLLLAEKSTNEMFIH